MLRQHNTYKQLKTFEAKLMCIHAILKNKDKLTVEDERDSIKFIMKCLEENSEYAGFTLFNGVSDSFTYRLWFIFDYPQKVILREEILMSKSRFTNMIFPSIEDCKKATTDIILTRDQAISLIEDLFEKIFDEDRYKEKYAKHEILNIFRSNLTIYFTEYKNKKCEDISKFIDIIKNEAKKPKQSFAIHKISSSDSKPFSIKECGEFILETLPKFYKKKNVKFTNADLINMLDMLTNESATSILLFKENIENNTLEWRVVLCKSESYIKYFIINKSNGVRIDSVYKKFLSIEELIKELPNLEFKVEIPSLIQKIEECDEEKNESQTSFKKNVKMRFNKLFIKEDDGTIKQTEILECNPLFIKVNIDDADVCIYFLDIFSYNEPGKNDKFGNEVMGNISKEEVGYKVVNDESGNILGIQLNKAFIIRTAVSDIKNVLTRKIFDDKLERIIL